MTDSILTNWRRQAAADGLQPAAFVSAMLREQPQQLAVLAACLGFIALDREALAQSARRFDLLPLPQALHLRVLPLEHEDRVVFVMEDPLSRSTRMQLQNRFAQATPCFAMSQAGSVDEALKMAESQECAMDDVALDAADDTLAKAVESISFSSLAKDESPVIRLVNTALYDALRNRASDIHLEAVAAGLAIRYRIDGVLQLIRQIPGIEVARQTIARLKVLSQLDIGEKRVPQDGRFTVALQGRAIDFRVSIMPGTFGENAVLRVLDKSAQGATLTLASLGFDAVTRQRIRSLAQLPYGLTLVTGPTGSGKSTTLYGVLEDLDQGDEKIITIEDPVEYELTGIVQIPVNEKKGLTFARGLRSILRHDPDTILVGEIRDEDTAAIAVQAALTGHRVLSSMHANDAFTVIDRFMHMGVQASTFLEALNGVISQRLVRRICPHCIDAAGSAGCEACRSTGYLGRIALVEVVRLTPQLKAAILEQSLEKRLAALANCADYQSLRDAGLAAVRQRLTTYEEVQRAVVME